MGCELEGKEETAREETERPSASQKESRKPAPQARQTTTAQKETRSTRLPGVCRQEEGKVEKRLIKAEIVEAEMHTCTQPSGRELRKQKKKNTARERE